MTSVYIIGIGGTFMASVAQLAKELGWKVFGVDQALYPPMSTQLSKAGITYDEGYENHRLGDQQFVSGLDCVIVGNAVSRGNPALEHVLDHGISYVSAPQWIAEHVLKGRHVLAISGTHGKTTTSSMLAWILECAGLSPGFLIGGVPENFARSARLGTGKYFVIEADEYDSAFCDKRSKFVHYRPNTLIINNIEFDHADIFPDLAAIQRQFHHMIRTMPRQGTICYHPSEAVEDVLALGCWSGQEPLDDVHGHWSLQDLAEDFSSFSLIKHGAGRVEKGTVHWDLAGDHNVQNARSAIAAASTIGIDIGLACEALATFKSVKRRMQLIAEIDGIKIFDDFAHHPTAIRLTLEGARKRFAGQRIVGIIEAGSNTMRSGVHDAQLAAAVQQADKVFWYKQQGDFSDNDNALQTVCSDIDELLGLALTSLTSGDVVVIMSNTGFSGFNKKLVAALGGNAL